jgi:hypothetical protein
MKNCAANPFLIPLTGLFKSGFIAVFACQETHPDLGLQHGRLGRKIGLISDGARILC